MQNREMDAGLLKEQLKTALARIKFLEEELNKTNNGMLALFIELEKKNEEAQAATQQLMQAAKLASIGELAASLAHELNNPLTTINLWVESLAAATDGVDHQQTLEIIASEVDRMAVMIKKLLDFSRRRGQYEVGMVDLCQELEYALELSKFRLYKIGIQVVRNYESERTSIDADRHQLQQLFLNLINNAADAMPTGGTLTVHIYTSPPDPDFVEVEVADNGVGISSQDLSNVMDPFFTTKPEGKGTGLGLSICRRIVQECCGHMNITSVPGLGTTVSLKFPLFQVKDDVPF
ncbi:MAG: ATP-binding protein [Syntrophomonas sp.]